MPPLTIAITIGDPSGIGPEVVAKALTDPSLVSAANWIVVGDAEALNAASPGWTSPASTVSVDDLAQLAGHDLEIGRLSPDSGRAALAYIRHATQLCLDGRAQAMVTAPVNKEAVTLTGATFTGHTEYIAELCHVDAPRMLLVNDRLRVLHVTTHIALREACGISSDAVLRTIEIGDDALERLGLDQRRIAVCGLNPHAGEHGLFGSEDAEIIAPAVETARSSGIEVTGPLPADTLFVQALRGAYDLVVPIYHDQGHIPMKLLDFEHTVNVSLGLPIVRTSVDHGTAFDIAGQNKADPSSMKAAMKLAVQLAARV
ncbi:MAG: 4-hydroxythreonine-4-phosphate dehydrogenase PdxA [Phycisphaeraceae bacterium]|nr:4-hydroxythreonine-4-phosphate dehydrogenase PdxA [Phycisphaeraceae bacterium]